MSPSPPAPPAPTPRALYRALIDQLAAMSDVEFADLDPHDWAPIPVPVSVKSRVVSQIQDS